jgi:hypothetical protein
VRASNPARRAPVDLVIVVLSCEVVGRHGAVIVQERHDGLVSRRASSGTARRRPAARAVDVAIPFLTLVLQPRPLSDTRQVRHAAIERLLLEGLLQDRHVSASVLPNDHEPRMQPEERAAVISLETPQLNCAVRD